MSRLIDFWNEGAAERLIKGLEDTGLRPQDLAESIQVDTRTVRNWMVTDRPPTRPGVQSFAQFCRILKIPQDEFRSAAEAYVARKVGILPPGTQSNATASEQTSENRPTGRANLYWVLVGSGLVIVAALAFASRGTGTARLAPASLVQPPPVTFELPSREPGLYDSAFGGDVSPDGSQIAFLARSATDGRRMLFVHSVADRTTRPLPESAGHYTSFFWNSDSRSIFYIVKTDLIEVDLSGGGSDRVGYVGDALRGAVNQSGTIVLGSTKGLLTLSRRGESERLTELDAGEVAHTLPSFLPDDDKVLFSITSTGDDGSIKRSLAVVSLGSRTVRRLFELPSRAHFAHNHLLWVEQDSLMAQPFDSVELRLTGTKVQVASPVWADLATGEAGFTVSPSVLVVMPAMPLPPLYRVASNGAVQAVISEPPGIRHIAAAKRSGQLAIAGHGRQLTALALWLHSREGGQQTPLVAGTDPTSLVFSPDERRIFYAAAGSSFSNIYSVEARHGSKPVSVLQSKRVVAPRDVSPDGRFLLYQEWLHRDGNLWYMPIGKPALAKPFISTAEEEGGSARFSPDGRSVAFVAKRKGVFSVYLADFPPSTAPPSRVIDGDGWKPRWSSDGRHIYFVRGKSVFRLDRLTEKVAPLFEMEREIWNFELASDNEFYVQETMVEPSRVVATSWWPRIARRPLKFG